MPKVEVSHCLPKDLKEAAVSMRACEASIENVLFHTIAELSDIAYQATKIPFAAGGGREDLLELMAQTVSSQEELEEIVDLRTEVYFESQTAREQLRGKEKSRQSVGWVWDKIRTEVAELEQESKDYQGIFEFGLNDGVADIKRIANLDEADPKGLLKSVFNLALFLGVRSELNLFKFMAAKQRGRIAMSKGKMTAQDKAEEWQSLILLARQYFK